MKTNLEIYSYLNIVNRRVGKAYKLTGLSPLSKDFVVDEEEIKRILFLKQMQNNSIFPQFILNNKKIIKNYFKNSLENCKIILKNKENCKKMSEKFYNLFKNYFSLRIILTKLILKDFRNQTFDETAAFQEIYNLDPIFGEIFCDIYDRLYDFNQIIDQLEEKYTSIYTQKLEILNKKDKKKKKQKSEFLQPKIQKLSKKTVKKAKNSEKNIEKPENQAEVKEKTKTTKQNKTREK